MNLLLLIAALTMSLIALSFLVRPLIVSARARNKGIAHLPLLIAVVAIIFAIALYAILGRPDVPSAAPHIGAMNADASSVSATSSKADNIAPVGSLLAGLEQRLQETPDDAKGWLLLAKSYQHLGQDVKAKVAYEKAAALGQSDATFEATLGATDEVAQSSHDAEIRGRIAVSETAAVLIGENDTIFVFAKAVNGPPMPLAVIRRPATDLPFEFVLSDEQSMVKGSGLSSVDQVIVTAKVTAPQDAMTSAPRLEVRSDPVATTGAPHLSLTLRPAAN